MNILSVLRVLLSPLSFLYGIFTDVRNYLFDKRLIKITSFDIPVISVGNLTAGGTGKTPFIIYLIEVLGKSFKQPAVVTRGYRRKTKGRVVVSDGRGNLVTADAGGDEPLLIARRHPRIVVIASENRAEGIDFAVTKFGCDIIFLDDAFQHRFVRRDCDIVLVNAREGKAGERLLPRGNLREPLRNINRADIVMVTKGSEEEMKRTEEMLRRCYKGPVYCAGFSGDVLVRPDFRKTEPLSNLFGRKIAAFCGIANSQEFFDMLSTAGSELCLTLSFPDHYNYSEGDIYQIIKSAQDANCDAVVTTEKDLVKLNEKLIHVLNLYGLRQSVLVTNSFEENVRAFIDKRVSN
jgi:tetraacyldisaccharide 4'-kinase